MLISFARCASTTLTMYLSNIMQGLVLVLFGRDQLQLPKPKLNSGSYASKWKVKEVEIGMLAAVMIMV